MIPKKTQTTLFAIISIILIIVVSFLFFGSEFKLFESSKSKIENQIKEIVDDCIFDSTQEASFLIGFQAGYIEDANINTLFSEQYSDLGLPIRNWDTQRDEIPTIDDMQTSIEEYVSDIAYSCTKNNLKSLEDLVELQIGDEFVIDVSINDDNIGVEAKLDISFSEKNSQEIYSLENYYVKLESLRLGRLYELAVEIYNKEAQEFFLEELVLDQIYSSSDYSSPESMPSEGIGFTCSKRIWTYPQLKENLARLNNNNFKYLYFDGTKSIDYRFDTNLIGDEKRYRDYFEAQYVIEIDNKKSEFKNFEVEVFMPSTEITGRSGILQKYPYRDFEVKPSRGNIVKPMDFEIDSKISKIPVPCIQVYHHLYTLDYDLMVKITDTNQDSQNYFFQYPLRVLIKDNNPKVKIVSQILKEPATANSESFCSEENRLYPMRVFVKDSLNGEYLSNVNITYKCINLQCDIGKTQKPRYAFNPNLVREFAQPYYEGNFPYCIQGQVIAQKEGYHSAQIRVDTDENLLNKDITFSPNDIELIPLKGYEIGIETFLLLNKDTGLGERVRSEEDGSIYVVVENEGYDFNSQIIWPTEEGLYDRLEFLNIPNIKYNVTMLYADKENNLKGIVEYENWEPAIYSGNRLRINIPISSTEITEDSYESFTNYVENLKLMRELILFG